MDLVLLRKNNRYSEREFETETSFEKAIFENYKMFFGQKTILINAKKKVLSHLGNTVPDGFLMVLNDPQKPEFYLVEIELYKHDFFRHIFPQVTKFFAFFRNKSSHEDLLDTLYDIVSSDKALESELRDYIGTREIYKFLKDMLDNSQNILLVLDKNKKELPEIIATYTDTWGKIVKVVVIKEYHYNSDNIYSISPNFEIIETVDVDQEADKIEPTSPYTEEYHLAGLSEEIKEIYSHLKKELLKKVPDLVFNPQRYYISLRMKKNFAYFKFRKNRIELDIMMPEDDIRKKIKYHSITSLSAGAQQFFGRPCAAIDIVNNMNLEEVIDLLLTVLKTFSK